MTFTQDLRAVNQTVEDIHLVMPNLYTLLTTLSGDFCWFTVLELKDALYCIPLSPETQGFAFEWDDPESDVKQRYGGMGLPQGLKQDPTTFREALASD